jgi:hypothetical protein
MLYSRFEFLLYSSFHDIFQCHGTKIITMIKTIKIMNRWCESWIWFLNVKICWIQAKWSKWGYICRGIETDFISFNSISFRSPKLAKGLNSLIFFLFHWPALHCHESPFDRRSYTLVSPICTNLNENAKMQR